MESAGATLGKGVNRAVATLLGGVLALGMHDLASLTEQKIEVVLLGVSVLLIGT